MHPSHEAGMNVTGRVGRDEIGIFTVDIAERRGLARNFAAKPRANLIRNRPPDRRLPDISDSVDGVIEHAMGLCAHIVPVRRIERLARSDARGKIGRRLGHAATSSARPARRCNIAAKASNTLRICGTLYGKISGGSMSWTIAVLSASKISNDPPLVSALSTVKL